MTHQKFESSRFARISGLLIGLALTLIPAGPSRADDPGFERAYEAQQKGISNYYSNLMKLGPRPNASEVNRLRDEHLKPAFDEGKKAKSTAWKKAEEQGIKDNAKGRKVFEQIRVAEKTGKSAPKTAGGVTESAPDVRTPASQAKKPEPKTDVPVEAIDGKKLDNVIDF